MRLRRVRAEDVDDFDAAADEVVGEQIPMTSPRDCFGAHDRGDFVTGEKRVDGVAKFVAGHVIGVRAELLVAPRGVGRVDARLTTSAELLNVNVFDADLRQCRRQRLAREMRIASRAGIAANVGEAFDAVFAKERDEFVELARRMADGENALSHAEWTSSRKAALHSIGEKAIAFSSSSAIA